MPPPPLCIHPPPLPPFPHTQPSQAQGKADFKHIHKFLTHLSSLFGHSTVAKNAFRELFGRAPVKQSIRWFIMVLRVAQLFRYFNGLKTTLLALRFRKCSVRTVDQLLDKLEDEPWRRELLAEMALLLDFAIVPFEISMTLEQDTYICHIAYRQLTKYQLHLQNFHLPASHPLLDNIIQKIAISQGCPADSDQYNGRVTALRKKYLSIVQPTIEYANKMFFNDDATLKDQVRRLRACELLDPGQIGVLQAQVVAAGGWLTALPFVDDHLPAGSPVRRVALVLGARLTGPSWDHPA